MTNNIAINHQNSYAVQNVAIHTLSEQLKAYFEKNGAMIAAGLLAMNGDADAFRHIHEIAR